ncbi:uncharacterized protein L203_102207 [Cryptococcus depauperatus CBS 7841]|uniref:Uncharacterized protein n=1 Tax=Cryptococcus depauperatus CBS 7841 TaxID=1295531 RepID=A0A1E3IRM4_9TREE|nr:translation initiation factor 2 subunit 2 [Cryptococcus depauperatus CBS 7841]
MKKKKKKAVIVEPSEESPAPELAAEPVLEEAPTPIAESPAPNPVHVAEASAEKPVEEDGELFGDIKKKKKKKKDIPLDLESAEPTSVDGLDIPMKKKKSKKTTDFSKELNELEAETAAADQAADAEGDLGEDNFAKRHETDAVDGGQEPWVLENRDPTYSELLKRFFSLLHSHNPELAGEKRKYTMVPPQVAREGAKKTTFSNIIDICRRMRRQPEHVILFLYSELGTTGSVDGSQRLIMKGKFTQKQIENVLRKYIVEYVTCKICKSPDTILEKENRLYFMTCESCGSRRSVSAIKTGFQAQIGKRIKAA